MSLLILKFGDNSCLLSNSRFTVHLQVLNINNISRTSRYLSEDTVGATVAEVQSMHFRRNHIVYILNKTGLIFQKELKRMK